MKPNVAAPILLAALYALTGCVFTTAKLDVGYPERAASRGPLSGVAPLKVTVEEPRDARPDTARIGYKKGGFGNKGADILTTRPVPQIVREALVAEFAKNGHASAADGADIVVSGEVTNFWFDRIQNVATLEFIGTVAMNVSVVDAKSGAPLIARAYQGYYSEKSLGGLDDTWQRVMNTALERMVREVSTDQRLLVALRAWQTTAESSPPKQ